MKWEVVSKAGERDGRLSLKQAGASRLPLKQVYDEMLPLKDRLVAG